MLTPNNRELALIIWIAFILIWALTKSDIRDSIKSVFSAMFARPIVIAVGAMFTWMTASLLLLELFGLWHWQNSKTTIVWMMTFALVTMFDVKRISNHDIFFKKTIRDAIGGMAVVTFIAELHSFPLILELIFLPILFLVTMMRVMTDYKPEFTNLKEPLDSVLSIAGISFIGWGIYQSVNGWEQVGTIKTLMDFITPIALTLAYLPFIYALSLYIAYERVNTNIKIFLDDRNLRSYAIWLAFYSFQGNLDALNRWSRKIASVKIADKGHARKTISEIIEIIERENNPPQISPSKGWSPYEAMAFLDDDGIKMGDYHEGYDEEWFATSETFEIRIGSFPDDLFYTVEGDERIAHELRLSLNTSRYKDEQYIEPEIFSKFMQKLLALATGVKKTDEILKQLQTGDEFAITIGNKKIETKQEKWSQGLLKGYRKKFIITHLKDNEILG